MAFDQTTRNRLQKFVTDARKLLSDEFTQQLQNTYGMDPSTGNIAEFTSLPSLSPSQQQTAKLLRDTLEHYLAANHKASLYADKNLVIAALERIVREQAFTILNRLAALRMAEARQFVLESISQSYQSKGFQLYQRIAGSALGETGQTYQKYLFSVFDELSLDLNVLFDRYSSQGRLFPRETVLLELLELINHIELEHLWAEDETIGWIYQYFNSKEERKKMRDESQAPRNSRELAVRNQFFTPRYVVEFLTDNTLGRIWYEMTKGKTALTENCQYLVRRPNEVFLKHDEAPDKQQQYETELSQEELLQQTVYIQYRPLKDPRDIKMLDPACGSMHFGLYAFDLFEQIYSEAWDLEESNELGCFLREPHKGEVRPALHQSYESKEIFLADVPKLIIENNIHGVDIDPRAAQIAGLSLWLRAQKSWIAQNLQPNQRPQIQRSNIVCAEPMPGEIEILKEFTSEIQPKVLGQLVEVIFDKMQLAGEAGTLLKIEEEIQIAIKEAKEQSETEHWTQDNLFGENKQVQEELRYSFDDGIDDKFWNEAESLILAELERYAESAGNNGSSQKRLFAKDAAKGFAFLDLCRKRFDVVLMNPPYGSLPTSIGQIVKYTYGSISNDFYALFVTRGLNCLNESGYLGCLSSRTFMTVSNMEKFRTLLLKDTSLGYFIDLGYGVLDGAAVETSSYFLKKGLELGVFSFTEVKDKEKVQKDLPVLYIDQEKIKKITGYQFAYKCEKNLLDYYINTKEKIRDIAQAKMGISTGYDYRYIRAWWEVEESKIGNYWIRFSKGGTYIRYYSPIYLVLNWKYEGKDIALENGARIQGKALFGKSGLTWPWLTSKGFNPRILPKNTIFANISPLFPVSDEVNVFALLGYFASNLVSDFLDKITPSRNYTVEQINNLPQLEPDFISETYSTVKQIVEQKLLLDSLDERSPYFIFRAKLLFLSDNFDACFNNFKDYISIIISSIQESDLNIQSYYHKKNTSSNNLTKDIMSLAIQSISSVTHKEYAKYIFSLLFGLLFNRWETKEIDTLLNPISIPNTQPSCSKKAKKIIPIEICLNNSTLQLKFENILNNIGVETSSDFMSTLIEYTMTSSIEEYINNVKYFFDDHYSSYSVSKRYAPIYWPLQIPSGEYTLWIYYHQISKQTLYICINDFVEPKLKSISTNLTNLKKNITRSVHEENELEYLINLKNELINYRDELLKIAKFWKPNLNDGVQITAAPLWKLFQHTAWQKKLKKTWEELEKGKYDWSHMAYNIWPERVLKKSHQDRSIAIAHEIENELWEDVEVPAKRGKGTKLKWQPKQMSDAELNTYIQEKIANK